MCQSDSTRQLLIHCAGHVLDDEYPLDLEKYCFANSGHADMCRGFLDSRWVAVKVWRGASLTKKFRQKFVTRLSNELDTWGGLQHPNIVPFLGVVSGLGHLPALVLPYYQNGHATEYLLRNPSANILHLLEGMASALSYMHNSTPPVAHGAVRGSNILIDDSGEACLSDIGINNIPYPPDWTLGNGDSARWMAPEIMDPSPDYEFQEDEAYLTPESDVYSLGMTALEMYTGRVPFAHQRFYGGVVLDVVRGVRPPRPACSKLTDDVWMVIQSCWQHDPEKRPSIGTIRAWLHLLSLNHESKD